MPDERIVELADELVAAAQKAGKWDGRSAAEQIEHWVGLGRVAEPFLQKSNTIKAALGRLTDV